MELGKLEGQKQDPIDVPLIFDSEGMPESGVKVIGLDSDQYQAADRKWKLANLKKSARRGRGIDATTDNGANELVDLVAKREMAIALACVVEIYGFTENGAPLPLGESSLEALFKARPSWRSKVVAAIETEQVFTPPSSEA